MLLAVVGGKLQGVEAVYLAKKAGWETLVIDKNPEAPAKGLCDRFLVFEFGAQTPFPHDCPGVDVILPALEDTDVLMAIKMWADMNNIPLAFDPEAYKLSCSKLKSDALFRKLNLPGPLPWPDCTFPVIVKPDDASGSQGVEVFKDPESFFLRFSAPEKMDGIVIQEYMDGPSYSIEVMGCSGNYQALQVTDLCMDRTFDCKRITAPTQLRPDQICRFEEMAVTIAEEIHLSGIMDVEVVLNGGKLRLLEIDARFPSQTPITVFWSTGINMVEILGNQCLNHQRVIDGQRSGRVTLVEHIRVSGSDLSVMGEHIMSQDGPLTIQANFFGCDEAITSFIPGKKQWVATLIFTSNSPEEMADKKQKCYQQILDETQFLMEKDLN